MTEMTIKTSCHKNDHCQYQQRKAEIMKKKGNIGDNDFFIAKAKSEFCQ